MRYEASSGLMSVNCRTSGSPALIVCMMRGNIFSMVVGRC